MQNSGTTRGMAGTIMVLLIFGLLMSVSTAYMKMVQTEIEVQTMVDHTDRAVDAAFSGINYAIAVAQTNKSMFENSVAACASRTYITSFSNSNWSEIQMPSGTSWNNTKVKTLVASVPSDWLFLNKQLTNYLVDDQSASPPYHFRVTSYPATSATAVADPSKFIIKSQGRFLTYDSTKTYVLATFTAQIIAECKINFARKVVQLSRYRLTGYDATDTKFYKSTAY